MKEPNHRFDCIIFDLFGVIISFDDDSVCRRIARHCTEPEKAFVAIRGLVSRDDLICGRLTLNQLREELIAAHRLDLGLRDFEAAWLTPYTAPMPGMADLIRTLAESYELVLLSNVDKYYWGVVREAHPELRFFSTQLLSWDLGMAKPNRATFLQAIEAARTTASRCFFVDDKSENVEAARQLGLLAHRFVGTIDLLEALEREGITY